MKYGLEQPIIDALIGCLAANPKIEEAILYGSRAKGNFKQGSDIDMTLKGDALTLTDVFTLENQIEDLLLPYKFDISILKQIENIDLLEHIQRVGIAFYKKNKVDTEGGASEWKVCKITDFAEVIGGGTPSTSNIEYWNGSIPWLTPRDLTGYNKMFIEKGERNITNAGLKKSSARLLPKGTVLITSRAPIGYVAIAKNEVCTNQGFKSLVINENKANNIFLYYWVKNNIDFLNSLGTGTTFAEISGSVIKEIEILLPPLPEQKAIAQVLSSLDDKIDLLHRQNATLEALAETLFRQWFVEEADDDTTLSLSEFALNIRDNVKVEDLKKYKYYVGLEHIPRQSISLTDWGKPDELESNKSLFKKNDILFGKLRSYFHKVVFTPISGVCSTDILVIRPKKKEWFSFCLFWFFSKDVVEFSDLGSGGTRMPRTSWEILSSYQVPKPNYQRIEEFDKIVRNQIEKITANITQIRTLTALRDTLLPKLMSGEVRVKM